MSAISLTNNSAVINTEKSIPQNSETFVPVKSDNGNSLAFTDNYDVKTESSEKYTFSRGAAAAAKIGIGLFAADLATQQIYPGLKDKRLHSLAGGVISGVTGEVTTALTGNKWVGILAGVGAGIIAGAAKELVDMQGYGTPDKHDFFATAFGSATVGASLSLPF
jgi:hypothetical protein